MWFVHPPVRAVDPGFMAFDPGYGVIQLGFVIFVTCQNP